MVNFVGRSRLHPI